MKGKKRDCKKQPQNICTFCLKIDVQTSKQCDGINKLAKKKRKVCLLYFSFAGPRDPMRCNAFAYVFFLIIHIDITVKCSDQVVEWQRSTQTQKERSKLLCSQFVISYKAHRMHPHHCFVDIVCAFRCMK